MKHFLITGGTGLIGSAVCQQLIAEHHHVTILSRRPEKVIEKFGPDVTAIDSLTQINSDTAIDVIINLAGAPIADHYWTKKRKATMESSRIDSTRDLVNWITHRRNKPECLISGSAVGWYGDCSDTPIDEQSTYNDEYTHQLCDAWEKQALRAGQIGVRVCLIRTGLVLAPNGGFVQKMRWPFMLGLGGKLGAGRQYMPWIHIDDMVNIITFLADNEQLKGVFNACSPSPVTNAVFIATLAKQLHRPAWLNVPSFLLKLLLGEMSRLLLTGQRAIPKKLQSLEFNFIYSDISSALADILTEKSSTRI